MKNQYFKYGNYELSPRMKVKGFDDAVFTGYSDILSEIKKEMDGGNRIFVFDLYPGVEKGFLFTQLQKLSPARMIDAEDCVMDKDKLDRFFEEDMTDDRVFGFLTHKKLWECFLPEKLEDARRLVENERGVVFVVGTGAGFITRGDKYLYFNLSRWEIQLRYRNGMPNWHCDNEGASFLTKYKRGFFIEWRMADRYKKKRFDIMDYMVDANDPLVPKMITGEAYRAALTQMARRPIRTKPYFDAGVWGGKWMEGVLNLSEGKPNYAWGFDGVPEENSLQLQFGTTMVEIPCIDLVFFQPHQLLGERVHGRFGAEFPIRFDLLDTMGGENLSLQVHPLTEYIQENFGMHYTQDESYYFLDTSDEEETFVYLGVKEGTDRKKMIEELKAAEKGNGVFQAENYVNRIPVKKHDHILIPAGTVHCSGKNTMVLEISATPYIFTFKLWDWGRLGLDGKPRPIHLEHGEQNIQWDRDTAWVYQNLVDQQVVCYQENGLFEEHTGLHPREFIETHRLTFSKRIHRVCDDSVHVLNLVDGGQITVTSPENQFESFEIHYAETFIIPAAVKQYSLCPSGISEGKTVKVIDAWVR